MFFCLFCSNLSFRSLQLLIQILPFNTKSEVCPLLYTQVLEGQYIQVSSLFVSPTRSDRRQKQGHLGLATALALCIKT